jgi:serine/threonine protein kinase
MVDETKETSVVTNTEDEEGNKLINNYIILRNIGKGSYGKVKLCIDQNNKAFVRSILEEI